MKSKPVIFHADDYAANEEISEHILDCYREGVLNSLSILPNSSHLDSCMKLFAPYREKIKTSIHFNLAEGHCLSKPSQVSWLVDERGMFSISFFKVLLLSFTRKKKELKKQIKTEMQAQLVRMLPYVDTLRIDSHQHYHMIPIVLESILEVVDALPGTREGALWLSKRATGGTEDNEKKAMKKQNIRRNSGEKPEIEFIRVPAEPLGPYLKHPGLYLSYRPINFVKNIVLNVLNIWDGHLLKAYRRKSAVFFGIMMSGEMDLKRVRTLVPDFKKIADRKELPLEVLCHPGRASRAEELMDPRNELCKEFYLSEMRVVEKETLEKI